MADLFKIITRFSQSFLEVNTISIDNWTFKCYYKISVVLAVFCSVIPHPLRRGLCRECREQRRTGVLLLDVRELRYSLDYKGVCSGKDQNDGIDGSIMYNSYYQWIPIYLGGLMKYFGKGTRTRKIEDHLEKRDRLVSYFVSDIHNKYDIYYYGFVFCEILNLTILILVFCMTNVFLNYRFKFYGFRVIYYYLLPPEEQKTFAVNPMCYTFPRISSCDYYRFGTAEITPRSTFSMRFFLFRMRLNRYFKNNNQSQKIEEFMYKCSIGDWFILYQLSKNINRGFFMDFLQCLVRQINPDHNRDSTGDNLMEMMLKPSYKSQDSDPRKAEE
ncbi:Innexin, partial [Caligus rogercresseyi]